MDRWSRSSGWPIFGLLILLLLPFLHTDQARGNGDLPPAGSFTFRVLWDGQPVVGIRRVSGLVRRTAVLEPRSGGDPNSVMKSPGLTTHEPIIIERRLTSDVQFEQWVNKVWNHGSGMGVEVSLRDFRKDMRIELFNDSGDLAIAYNVYRCWPSEYVVIGEMEGDVPTVPVGVLVIEHEGWERDHEIVPAP